MRQIVDADKVRLFMRALGAEADEEVRLYFTGGATAVLLGWRDATIDLDIRFIPESDRVFRAIPRLKEELQINVELASPADFIPELPGWENRCIFIGREGRMSFYHYDPYAQVLAKIERGHTTDRTDVRELIRGGWADPAGIMSYFDQIEPRLYRYPAIDPASFRRAVEQALKETG